MIAVVRVRGSIGVNRDILDTMGMLNLHRQNYCVLLNDSPGVRGMLRKAKDYITWGEIDGETKGMLLKKSGKKFFRLNPPRKGFGRKGIKKPFSVGGALGNRKEKISELVRRML